MQKRNVNEVVANNSTHTPAPIVRITSEHYARMADVIFDSFEAGQDKTITHDDDDFVMEFSGYAERGKARWTPRRIVSNIVKVDTYTDEGDMAENDFCEATLMAFVNDLVTKCYDIALTDC